MMDSLTSVLDTVRLKDMVKDGKLRSKLYKIDTDAFLMWALGESPLAIGNRTGDRTLTQTITLWIGDKTDDVTD